MLLYLVVAFMDPGYVTSYVAMGGADDFEEDIESMKRDHEKSQLNSTMSKPSNNKRKMKRSVLSRAASKISRKERINVGNSVPSNPTQYQQVLDYSSNRCTPRQLDASHNKFVFSNMTTQNFEPQNNETSVIVDNETALNK